MANPGDDGAAGGLGPGDTVGGRYALEQLLGEGASGVVFVARRVDSAESADRVALKVIHRHLVKDRQISRRFHREAAILRKLDHPNLVPLLDFGEAEDGMLYMALELVEGTALDVVTNGGALPVGRAVQIVRQVLGALETAHAAGVVHRDLKPGNVLVESAVGGAERARVLDFGMAKVLRGEANDSITALTEQNMVFGTPEYMAPEQARGDEVDGRCDVYAAGVLLYELVTGTVPFSGTTPIGVMTAHLTDPPPPPSSRSASRLIPPAVEAVILHALAKCPRDRYPTPAMMAHALEMALARPDDLASTRPPPTDDDLEQRDTEWDVTRPDGGSRHGRRTPMSLEPANGGDRLWLFVAIVAAALGIGAGILVSLLT